MLQFSWISLALCLIGLTSAVHAQSLDLNSFEAWIDVRTAVSTSGREWLQGGPSKTRYGGDSDVNFDAEIAEATFLWTPRFTTSLEGHLNLQSGPDQSQRFSAVEAFLRYRALPTGPWRLSAKAGRFYPPISYEHDGPAWSMTRTITPSAINSWIGEEVIVIGAEARAARSFGDHFVDFRASAFGFNDTAGALISFRGWALHDIKSVIGGSFQIPDDPNRRVLFPLQAERTFPTKEIDDRVGFYAAGRWRYSDLFQIDILAYDNRADPEVLVNGQYDWRTRFVSFGLKTTSFDRLEIIAQGLFGETAMGPPSSLNPDFFKIDDRYAAAYVLASYASDFGQFTVRGDHFRVSNEILEGPPRDETGWSATAAFIKPFADHFRLAIEALYVSHNRLTLRLPRRRTNDFQVQTSLQIHY